MKIVIDLPEEMWERGVKDGYVPLGIGKYLRNGTPLPKGHGRLIECEPIYDRLMRSYRADKKDYPERGKDYRIGLSQAIDLLNAAPAIIEADKERKE